MSNVRDEFGSPVYQTDEYGNPMYQTDQYGNPIQPQAYTAETGTGTGGEDYGYGTAPTATGYGGGEPVMGATVGQTQAQPIRTEPEYHEGLQRSKSSSSSSSSEDDGQGGRRKKKGLKEKIKEKIPGMGHKKEEGHHTGTGVTATTGTTTTGTTTASTGTTGYGHEQQHHGEKKGIMEKIKEKLPGGGGHH